MRDSFSRRGFASRAARHARLWGETSWASCVRADAVGQKAAAAASLCLIKAGGGQHNWVCVAWTPASGQIDRQSGTSLRAIDAFRRDERRATPPDPAGLSNLGSENRREKTDTWLRSLFPRLRGDKAASRPRRSRASLRHAIGQDPR